MPRTGAVHLGVDVGTSGVRGVAIDANGAVVAQASAPLPPPESAAGGLRQDPELWWTAVTSVIRAIGAATRATGSIPWRSTGPRARCCWRTTRACRSSPPACTTTPAPPIWPGASRAPPRRRAVPMGRPRPWPGCSCCRSGIRTRDTRCIRRTGSPPGSPGAWASATTTTRSSWASTRSAGAGPTGSTISASGAGCCPRW